MASTCTRRVTKDGIEASETRAVAGGCAGKGSFAASLGSLSGRRVERRGQWRLVGGRWGGQWGGQWGCQWGCQWLERRWSWEMVGSSSGDVRGSHLAVGESSGVSDLGGTAFGQQGATSARRLRWRAMAAAPSAAAPKAAALMRAASCSPPAAAEERSAEESALMGTLEETGGGEGSAGQAGGSGGIGGGGGGEGGEGGGGEAGTTVSVTRGA